MQHLQTAMLINYGDRVKFTSSVFQTLHRYGLGRKAFSLLFLRFNEMRVQPEGLSAWSCNGAQEEHKVFCRVRQPVCSGQTEAVLDQP